MGRRRAAKNRDLPPNLYVHGGYYSWRDPRDGKFYGIGNDKRQAIAEANEANLAIIGGLNNRRIVDRLEDNRDSTVAQWCTRYADILEKRGLAQTTADAYRRRLAQFRSTFETTQLARIGTREIAEFLQQWSAHPRMAQAVRSLLLDLFREAIAAGWIDRNPVEPTRPPRNTVKRARLSLDDFRMIHEQAASMPPWVQRALELAIVTAQRRGDVAAIGPRDVRDGKLWIVQQKTGTRLCIPLGLRLNALGWSLGEIVDRCRDGILSRHFLHHVRHIGKAKPGDPVRNATLSDFFAQARDLAGVVTPEGRTPVSFHEIRSLAARLYADQGLDVQTLLGHKSAAMTATYRDGRGMAWSELRIA